MFELHVNDTDATNGSIPVSWCMDKSLLEQLSRWNSTDPQVLIIVSPVKGYDIRKEYRQVVPLKDMMAYVQLHCVGENRIWAILVATGKKATKDTYLHKSGGSYMEYLLDSTGEDWSAWVKENKGPRLSNPITVEVPAGCFAPPPSEFEKRWVNWLFHDKVVDQCQFRRRRLFAYSAQLFLMFGYMLPRLFAVLVALLIADSGTWEVIKRAFSPLTYEQPDVFGELKGSILIRSWEGEQEELNASKGPDLKFFGLLLKKVGLFVFSPLVLGALFLLIHFSSHAFAILGATGCGIVLLLVTTSVVIWMADNHIIQNLIKALSKTSDNYWYEQADEAELILCDGTPKIIDVNALPKKHRTLKLRFQQLKSQVCKPFSR